MVIWASCARLSAQLLVVRSRLVNAFDCSHSQPGREEREQVVFGGGEKVGDEGICVQRKSQRKVPPGPRRTGSGEVQRPACPLSALVGEGVPYAALPLTLKVR